MPIDSNRQSDYIDQKTSHPTDLKSDEIKQYWTAKMREQAMFSARTTTKEYLDSVKEILHDYVTGVGPVKDGQNEGEPISMGQGRARMLMYEKLMELGLVGEADGDSKRIDDLASSIRLNLIVETNTQIAHSLDQLETASDPIQKIVNPCWELVRDEARNNPRNWLVRWHTAATNVGWDGVAKNTDRMIAMKDSPIWQELGNAEDGLGNPYPPFAFGSGMGWEIVTADGSVTDYAVGMENGAYAAAYAVDDEYEAESSDPGAFPSFGQLGAYAQLA